MANSELHIEGARVNNLKTSVFRFRMGIWW